MPSHDSQLFRRAGTRITAPRWLVATSGYKLREGWREGCTELPKWQGRVDNEISIRISLHTLAYISPTKVLPLSIA